MFIVQIWISTKLETVGPIDKLYNTAKVLLVSPSLHLGYVIFAVIATNL